MNKLPFILAFLFFSLAITATVMVKTCPPADPLPPMAERNQQFGISEIRVLSGHEFSLKLKDGRNIHAFLEIETIPEATKEVLRKVHKVAECSLLFKARLDKGWVVDILVVECTDTSCRRVSLTQWLKDSKLAWE